MAKLKDFSGLRGGAINLDWCIKFRRPDGKPWRLGLTWDTIGRQGCPYMRRIVLWLEPLCTLRLHKFLRSDTDDSLHDHPWWFITFPLSTYHEWVEEEEKIWVEAYECCISTGKVIRRLNEVKRWMFHFRPALHRHAVMISKPCYTFVISGTRFREWGFWVKDKFVHWKNYNYDAPCADPK